MTRLLIALSVCAFFVLPVTQAAKPPKPGDELEARVEALESQIAVLEDSVTNLVVVDGNSEEVGMVLGFYPGETSLTDFAHFADRVSIMRTVDSVDFIFSIGFHEGTGEWTFEARADSDKQGGLGWVSNDCSGTPFKADVEGGFNDMRNDIILNDQVSGTSRYFVIERTATTTTVATQSRILAPTGGCSVNDPGTITNGLPYAELTPGPYFVPPYSITAR